MPLMQAFGGILTVIGTANRMFGADTGICRLDCTFDPATRGAECPDEAFTCDRFGGVCIEACTSDNECNTAYGATYDGELVTLVNHMHADHCNMTTGRCEPVDMGTAAAVVGTHCESAADCAPTKGICLNGGHCAEFGCATPGAVCGGTASAPLGICLNVNGTSHSQALCLQGCTTANDCGAGNVCAGLMDAAGNPGMIGPFGGYCIGVCDSDSACIASESCTDYNTIDATSGAVTANNGRCVPRCTDVGSVGTGGANSCATDEWCSPDATNTAGTPCQSMADCASHAPFTMCSFGVCRSSVPTFGQCTPLGAFCGDSNSNHLLPHQGDCATTQVCDETLATPHSDTGAVDREVFGDGHCTNPCTTTADCTGYPTGSVCVTTGAYAGLCRVPCTGLTMPNDGGVDAGADGGGLSSSECPADQACDTVEHFCVEVAPPAA
jgi:hypothetical protein